MTQPQNQQIDVTAYINAMKGTLAQLLDQNHILVAQCEMFKVEVLQLKLEIEKAKQEAVTAANIPDAE